MLTRARAPPFSSWTLPLSWARAVPSWAAAGRAPARRATRATVPERPKRSFMAAPELVEAPLTAPWFLRAGRETATRRAGDRLFTNYSNSRARVVSAQGTVKDFLQ